MHPSPTSFRGGSASTAFIPPIWGQKENRWEKTNKHPCPTERKVTVEKPPSPQISTQLVKVWEATQPSSAGNQLPQQAAGEPGRELIVRQQLLTPCPVALCSFMGRLAAGMPTDGLHALTR